MIRVAGLRGALYLALAALLAAALPGAAQPVFVTAGEHAGFTRIVLQSASGFAWSLAEDGAELRLALPGRTLRADPDAVFSRIPRTRLAALRIDGETLVLTRPCLCPARSFEDRPGVLVIDLQDGAPLPDPAPSAAAPPRPEPAGPVADPSRSAGLALARRLATDRPDAAPAPDDPAVAAAQALALGRTIPAEIAAAMTRGLLPPPEAAQAPQALSAPVELSGLPVLPPNLTLRSADAPVPPPQPEQGELALRNCPVDSVFVALTEPLEDSFSAELAALRAALYGEFDQPDPANWLALAGHYLRWGLGAEARQILDLEGLGIEHREFLGGLADLIEDHASNRRARLARHLGCPGPVALFAWLAMPPDQPAPAQLEPIVAVFQTLTPGLREALGAPMVRRLIADRQMEAARMVAETAGRGGLADDGTQAVLDALVEQARGAFDRAAARLEAALPTDLAALQLRLDLALAQGNALPQALLLDAETIAESVRSTDLGRSIGALVIRHHALAGALDPGFALLDRFSQWGPTGPDHRARVVALRSALWFAAAGQDDATFLIAALERGDWRDPELDAPTRTALAARFEGLGLPRLAAEVGRLVPLAEPAEAPGAAISQPDRPAPPLAAVTTGPLGREPPASVALSTGIQPDARAAPRAPAPVMPLAAAPPLAPTVAQLALPPALAEMAIAANGAAEPGTPADPAAPDGDAPAAPPGPAPGLAPAVQLSDRIAVTAPPPPGAADAPAQAQAASEGLPPMDATVTEAASRDPLLAPQPQAALPPTAPAAGQDPMGLSVFRLEESAALRAALTELGLAGR